MKTASTPLRTRGARRPRPHALARAAAVTVAFAAAGMGVPAQAAIYTWNSGNFIPGTTAPSPLPAADILNIETGSNKFFNGAASNFTNGGTVNWNADALYLMSGTAVVNNALWNATSDSALVYNGGSLPSFTNNGTFSKSAGAGATTINLNVGFVNNGTLDAQTGSINFVGGSVFNAGSVFTGAGLVNLSAGTNTFNGAFISSNLLLSGGTHSGNGAVVGGSVGWTGGTLAGTWAVAAGQTLNGQAGTNKFLSNAGTVLTNLGTIAWNTTDNLYVQSAGAVSNQGLFVGNASAALVYLGGTLPVFDNTASGTVRAAAGQTLTIGNNTGFVNNGGTLDAQAGGSITYAGTSVFNAGTQFTGAGSNLATGSNAWNGAFNSANLVLQSGTHTGSGAVASGSVGWTGGTLAGTWTVAAGQTLNGQAGGNKFLSNGGTLLTNLGTIAWNTTDNLYVHSAGAVSNQGLFVANASTALVYNGGTSPAFDNTASGTVRAAAGQTLTIGNNTGFVNNGGTLDAQTGGSITYAGTSVFNAGTQFTGAGSNRATGSNAWNGAFNSANLVLQSGTHTGSGAVASGSVGWTGGTLAGTWTVAAGQTLNGQAGGNKFLSNAGTVLTNSGTLAWQTTDNLYMASGATLANQGTLDFSADASVVYSGGALPSFVNTGLIVKSAGAGTTSIGGNLGFDNQGTVDVQAGTLALPANFNNSGTLKGVGTYSVTGMLTNAGTLAPGASPGTLTLNGNYTQAAAGSFAVELESLASHDLFNISGTAALGGTLALSCWAACSYAVGDVITILDAAGALSNATFASVTLSGFATGAFDVIYDTAADRVQLLVTEAVTAVPEPGAGALWLAGLAALGAVARRRRAR